MVEEIKLSRPVLIDNKAVRVLTYDIDEITSEQFIEAEILAGNVSARLGKFAAKVAEVDAGFHYYLGVMAILAANPEYAAEDIERVKGPDVRKIMNVGRNFMTADAEEDEGEDFESAEEDEDEETENFQPEAEYEE